MSVNKVIIVGRLGQDPELKEFPNGGKIANLRVATSERWTDRNTGELREQTEWHRITLNDRLADVAAQYLRKGSQVYIEGSIRTRKYQDPQTGQDRYTTEIRGTTMQMLGSNPNSQGGNQGNQNFGNQGGYPNQNYGNQGGFSNQNYGNQGNQGNHGNQNYNQNRPMQNQNFGNQGGFANQPQQAMNQNQFANQAPQNYNNAPPADEYDDFGAMGNDMSANNSFAAPKPTPAKPAPQAKPAPMGNAINPASPNDDDMPF